MKPKVKGWFIAGTIFTIIVGTLLHFVYEWTGENSFAGIFGAVNESTWEHLKLLFWPAFIFSIAEYFAIGKNYNNYITAKAVSFYIGLLLIITLFYTYTGILGNHYPIIDILIFIISVILSQYIGYRITVSDKTVGKAANVASIIAIILLAAAFIVFTFYPPQIPLFKDPLTGEYGI